MSTGDYDGETAVPDSARGTRRVVIQAGMAAAALALIQAAASASPTLQPKTAVRRDVPKLETLDGARLLRSLQSAGLDPKRLDLSTILDSRSDIEELTNILHSPQAMRKGGKWDGVTIQVGYFAK